MSDPAFDRIVLETPLVTVGRFRVRPDHPEFRTAGAITRPVLVFPRTSVWIRHAGRPAFVADPGVVTCYNAGQPYTREAIAAEGDDCDWFALAPELLAEALGARDAMHPFGRTWGPSDARSYLVQRVVVRRAQELGERASLDALAMEEAIVGVLDRIAPSVRGRAPRRAASCGEAAARRLAARAREALAARFAEPLGLGLLAAELGCSPFHLCRVFHRHAGSPMARHRTALRLRRALHLLEDGGRDLGGIALEVGFASHAHFTAAFSTAFGEPPSAFRERPTSGRLRDLARKISKAAAPPSV